jgi:hypothetical protein
MDWISLLDAGRALSLCGLVESRDLLKHRVFRIRTHAPRNTGWPSAATLTATNGCCMINKNGFVKALDISIAHTTMGTWRASPARTGHWASSGGGAMKRNISSCQVSVRYDEASLAAEWLVPHPRASTTDCATFQVCVVTSSGAERRR